MRNLDPEVFPPELATNLTLIIQGLIVLLVSAPVIVTAMYKLRPRRARRRRQARDRRDAAPPPRPRGVERPVLAGWAAVALAILAFWLALPPLLSAPRCCRSCCRRPRSCSAGGRSREGQRRLGWAAAWRACWRDRAIAATRSGEGNLDRVVIWSALAAAMLRFATPLIFAALGGVVSERSGVVNIGLEGMMLVGAFFGIYGADLTGSWLGGLLLGMFAGGVLALVHAVFAISLRADQIVSGFAINFLGLGITGYIFLHHYGEQGTPDGVPRSRTSRSRSTGSRSSARRSTSSTCSSGSRSSSSSWSGCSSSARPPACACDRSARTREPRPRWGSRSTRSRYLAVIASGVLAAMGGAFLSIGFVHSFNENMTAGRGFIALAVVIVGKWRPVAALAAALMFGFSQALAQRLAVFSESSATLLQALPYVVTLIAVAGLVGRSTPPAADGVPYSKE